MLYLSSIINLVKDVSQILFWCLAGGIACLSYMQARKSIFQPAKNEVFKAQIENLQVLVHKLNWKSGLEAWRDSGLRDSAEISLNQQFKLYAKERLLAEIQLRDDEGNLAVGAIFSPDAAKFILIHGPADSSDKASGWVHKPTDWENYTWEIFEISARHQETIELLDVAINNPILPKEIILILISMQKELHDTAIRAAQDLETAVRELPRHYPTDGGLEGANLTWAQNMRKERGEMLFDKLNELKKAIRDYLKTDELFGQ